MPSIRPYNAQVSPSVEIGGRRASASDFTTVSGSEGQGFQQAGAALYQYAEQSEVSDAHARLATARAEWTVTLAERLQKADPADPNFAADFNKDLGAYLDKAGGYATTAGQRAYQQGASELAAHFVAQAGVAQAKLVGEKAKQDFETLANKSSLAVYNDPTQFDSALKSVQAAIFDPNSSMARIGGRRGELFDKAKERMALAAIEGTINLSPELAQRQLADGKWNDYIAVEQRDKLDTEIKTAIRAQEIEKERLRAADDRAKRERDEATSSAIFDNIVLGKATTKDILNSGLKRPEKEALFNFMKARSGESDRDEKTYGADFVGMLQRINTDNPPDDTEILNKVGKGITTAGANQLMAWKNGRKTAEGAATLDITHSFLQGAKQIFEGPVVMGFPKYSQGGLVYSNWLQYALPEIERQKKAGKPLSEILGPKGPLADSIQVYRPSYQDMMADIMAQSAGLPKDPTGGMPPILTEKSKAPASVTVPIAPSVDVAKATRTGKKGGRPVYEIDGKWVYGDGSAVQ